MKDCRPAPPSLGHRKKNRSDGQRFFDQRHKSRRAILSSASCFGSREGRSQETMRFGSRVRTKGLPTSVLWPTVTKGRELLSAGDALSDAGRLRRVLNLPVNLDELHPQFREVAERFIRWAKKHGAADGYIAQHRRAWWSVPLYDPAPIICTYMARRPPAFVRNLCQARLLNIAHGLYPRCPLDAETISGLLYHLRRNVGTASGRTYAAV